MPSFKATTVFVAVAAVALSPTTVIATGQQQLRGSTEAPLATTMEKTNDARSLVRIDKAFIDELSEKMGNGDQDSEEDNSKTRKKNQRRRKNKRNELATDDEEEESNQQPGKNKGKNKNKNKNKDKDKPKNRRQGERQKTDSGDDESKPIIDEAEEVSPDDTLDDVYEGNGNLIGVDRATPYDGTEAPFDAYIDGYESDISPADIAAAATRVEDAYEDEYEDEDGNIISIESEAPIYTRAPYEEFYGKAESKRSKGHASTQTSRTKQSKSQPQTLTKTPPSKKSKGLPKTPTPTAFPTTRKTNSPTATARKQNAPTQTPKRNRPTRPRTMRKPKGTRRKKKNPNIQQKETQIETTNDITKTEEQFLFEPVIYNPPPVDDETTKPPAINGDETVDSPAINGNETVNPSAVNGDDTTKPPNVDGNETADPPALDGDKTVDPPTVNDDKTVDPPPVDGDETLKPAALDGDETTKPPATNDDKTVDPPTVNDDKTVDPPAVDGDDTLKPAELDGDETTKPPATNDDKTVDPPAINGDDTPKPRVINGDETLKPGAVDGDETVDPPAVDGDKTVDPPAVNGDGDETVAPTHVKTDGTVEPLAVIIDSPVKDVVGGVVDCPQDLTLVKQTGSTTTSSEDPILNAVTIVQQSTSTVTVNLNQIWGDEGKIMNSVYYQFFEPGKDFWGSSRCYEQAEVPFVSSAAPFETIEIACNVLKPYAELELCLVDNVDNGILSPPTMAEGQEDPLSIVPKCCYPDSSIPPVQQAAVCYLLEIQCVPSADECAQQ